MATGQKEVLLIGLGAVGAIYGLALKLGGRVNLTVVARSNFDVIQANGLTFRSDKNGDHIKGWRPNRLVPSVLDAANQRYDYVFVSTKVIPEILPTEKILAPILSKSYTEKYGQPVYVLLQNGIGIEKGLAIAVENVAGQVAEDPESTQVFDDKKPRIVSACLYYLGNLIKPDVVEYVEGHKITIGVYRSGAFTTTQNSPQEAEVLDDVKNLLEPGGASVEVVSEIQRHRLKKNMLNLSFAAIATLSNQTTPSIFRPPPNPSSEYYEPYVHPMTAHLIEEYTVPNIAAVLTEAVSVARALDIPDTEDGLPLDTVPKFIELARVLHVDPKNNHASSMLLDMRKGRPMEVEVILGEVVRLAKRVAVDVPRIEMMYSILLVVQNQILRKLENA